MRTAIFFPFSFMDSSVYPLLAASDVADGTGNIAVDHKVDQERTIGFERPDDGRPHLGSGFHPDRGYPQRFGQSIEPEFGATEVEESREFVCQQPTLLPVLLDVDFEDPVAAVIADHDLGADLMVRGRPQRLDRVHGAPVAGEAEDGPFGVSQLEPKCSGYSHPQRAAPGLKVAAGPG